MSVTHLNTRKRARKHRETPAGDAESITYDPIETAARLAVQYAEAEAAKTGHLIHEDYAADLVTMFGEELRCSVQLAVSVVREPFFVPFTRFTIPDNI